MKNETYNCQRCGGIIVLQHNDEELIVGLAHSIPECGGFKALSAKLTLMGKVARKRDAMLDVETGQIEYASEKPS